MGRGEGASTAPSRPSSFSLSLAGGGSGWGSPTAGYVHPDPPPDLPPVRGEEYGWAGGRGVDGQGGGSGWGARSPYSGIFPSSRVKGYIMTWSTPGAASWSSFIDRQTESATATRRPSALASSTKVSMSFRAMPIVAPVS